MARATQHGLPLAGVPAEVVVEDRNPPRAPRPRRPGRGSSLNPRRVTTAELEALAAYSPAKRQASLPVIQDASAVLDEFPLPETRGECPEIRPCPHVSCRYNTFLNVNPKNGTIKLRFPKHVEPWEVPPETSCALDVGDRGAHTLEETGQALNVSIERVRQIEEEALVELATKLGIDPDELSADLKRRARLMEEGADEDEED